MSAPLNPRNDVYLVNQSGLATFYGPWFDASACKQLSFTISWSAVAATAGTLAFEVTNDSAQAVAGVGGTNVVAVTAALVVAAGGTYPTVSTSAANCHVAFENCSHWVRLVYTRSAGGGAGQFQAFAHGRSV